VPLTNTGTLARVDVQAGTVVGQLPLGPPAPAGSGDLDSAVAAGGVVFAASDAGGRIIRSDGARPSTFRLAPEG
jgi:hypothetical protein